MKETKFTALFSPAVSLMEKLSYPRKFLILGMLLGSMTVVLLFSLFISLNQTIATSNKQVSGLGLITPTSKVIQLIQRYRSASIAVSGGNDKINPELIITSNKLIYAFNDLDKKLPDSIRESHSWGIIQSDMTALRESSHFSPMEHYALSTRIIARIITLNRAISEEYKLSVNTDVGADYLLDAVVFSLPLFLEDLGRISSIGMIYSSGAPTDGIESSELLISDANRSLTALKSSIEQIKVHSPELRDGVSLSTSDIIDASVNIIDGFVSLTEGHSVDSDIYFREMTSLLDKGFTSVYSSLLLATEDVIRKQSHGAQDSIFIVSVITFLTMSIIIYLSVGNYYSVISNVKGLAEATDRFATGDFTARATVTSRDELGKICETFNRLAEWFSELMQETAGNANRLNSIINASMDAVVQVDSDGIVTGWNTRAEQLFGWSKSDVIGQLLAYKIIPGKQHALNGITIVDYLTDKANLPIVRRLELDARHQSGHVISIEMSISNIYKGNDVEFNVFIRDISQEREVLDRLKLSDMFFNGSSEAMFITDADNLIIAINPSFTRLTGYSSIEAIGKTPSLLRSGRQDDSFYASMWKEINEKGTWRGDIWNRRKDGTSLIEMLSISTIYSDDGSVHKRAALFSDVTDKKKSEDIIWRQANFDTLTGLPNRHMFNSRLEEKIKSVSRDNSRFALMFIDLDRFKEVNDSLGHEAGDFVLKQAAERLTACVRATDTVARLGGDEFTVILSNTTSPDGVIKVAEAIVNSISKPFEVKGELVYISASIGIAICPDDAINVDDILSKSDQAMYKAKAQGKNCYALFTSDINDDVKKKIDLVNSLRKAIANEEFSLNYQPIIELETGKIIKAEALIRWIHPEKGFISPADFIPVAEETGFINEIGDWVFREVIKEVAIIRRDIDPKFQININKSPVQFEKSTNHDAWMDFMKEQGVPGDALGLEITEGVIMGSPKNVNDQLLGFRAMGIEVSIDDFGTGYSSLSYLQDLDVDYLKIDQKFTRGVTVGQHKKGYRSLIGSIVAMAHALDIKVVAEGVETEQQLNYMKSVGCDLVQGYLLSMPLPAIDFRDLLERKIKESHE